MRPSNHVGPWHLARLQGTPRFERRSDRTVRDGERATRVSEMYFDVEPFLGRAARAFGYLAMPAQPAGPLPAMLIIHGGGGTAREHWARLWAQRGYAAFAIDLYGQGPNRSRMPDGGCDWSDMDVAFEFTRGVENSWIYHSVATSIHAVSVLRALPEVDPLRIGVTGVSWGGYLTHGVMCVDDRIALGIPTCGCGFNHRAGHARDASPEKRKRVFDLFDPSNYSDRCTKPVLWVGGINDPPPDQLMKCYRAIPGPQSLSIRLVPGHCEASYVGTAYEQIEAPIFADSFFRGTDPLPRVEAPVRDGGSVTSRCLSRIPIFTASLHWTEQSDGPQEARRWSSARANVKDHYVEADLGADACIAYFTVVDDRGAMSSSPFIGLPE